MLTQADILEMEASLRQLLGKFLKFSNLAIYFPDAQAAEEPILISNEKRLLLPLRHRGNLLAMAALEDIGPREAKKISHILPQIAEACLDTLAMARALRHDPLTGLLSEDELFRKIEIEVENLRDLLADPGRSGRPLYRICFGMVVISWHEARAIASQYDYNFCRLIYTGMASSLAQALPGDTLAAPLGFYEGRYEFGLLFTATGRQACQRLAQKTLEVLEKLEFTDGLSHRVIHPKLHAGHALYPQDMLGEELRLPVFEQAMRLRDRARYASRMAAQTNNFSLACRILPFAGILRTTGRIMADLGHNRVRVNLGLAANAREGMRFNILSSDDRSDIGQIVLLETGNRESVAEILYLVNAMREPLPGDMLVPGITGSDDDLWHKNEDSTSTTTSAGNFLGHSAFLAAFAKGSRNMRNFVLGICRTSMPSDKQIEEEYLHKASEFVVSEVKSGERTLLSGRYGSADLIFFHSGNDMGAIKTFYEGLHSIAKNCGLEAASGLFAYPFLDFGRSQSEACALKALEYAQLLPEPHIGVFDSLALNISADRLYSLGDAFAAIEEYKLALLADPQNVTARNSLGVCLAGLGKMEKAKKQFLKALSDCEDGQLKGKICYNLGTIWQKDGNMRKARAFYKQCLAQDGEHFFAWLKMGQISELKGRRGDARNFYEKADALAGENVELRNLISRHMAKLDAQDKGGTATELLHESLLRDPRDAASLTLLAQIHLENGGDPEIAETLARRSANLNGGAEAWDTLARALAAQGRNSEAEEARARAERDQS